MALASRATTAGVTGSRRTIVLIGVVAALAVALWLYLRKDADDRAPSAASDRRAEAPASGGGGGPVAHRPDRDRARGPDRGTPAMAGDGESQVYVTDQGRVVRDHRPSGTGDPPLFPAPMPPEQRTMSSVLTSRIYQQLTPLVAGCGKEIAEGDRGASPTVMVTLTVDVAGGNLTATDVHAGSVDIGEGSRERVAACVREKAAGLSLPSGDEPDRTDYVAQFPVRLSTR